MKLNKQILELAFRYIDPIYSKDLLCLCSGGVDSIAIAHFLKHNEYIARNYNLKIMHINHNYRPQNYEMAESVRNFCLTFRMFILNVRLQHNKLRKNFTEAYLREKRNEILDIYLSSYTKGNPKIVAVTAHHLDDCVESYLLNCIRGHQNYNPIPCITKFEKHIICRPFILNKKSDFIEYCEKHDLMKYVVEDTTNSESVGSRRNMIRNEIIPLLNRDSVGMHKIVKKFVEKRISLDLIKN